MNDGKNCVGSSVAEAPVKELFPGIRIRPLWNVERGAKALVVEMDRESCWGTARRPREVFEVRGTSTGEARTGGISPESARSEPSIPIGRSIGRHHLLSFPDFGTSLAQGLPDQSRSE